MRTDMIKAQIAGMPFVMMPNTMDMYANALNNNAPQTQTLEKVANKSVEYETIGKVAIISVDGAMWKKNIDGACGESVASYSDIVSHIDKAEADNNIEIILFIVDTPGGSVAGVDEVGDRIYNSLKRTVTIFVNIGASGGLWAFTASDELYATPVTMIGSIGVVVAYLEDEDEEKKIVTITSKNAENKRCKIGEDCRSKIKKTIDIYEDIFFSRITRNTGFSSDDIVATFNNGDMIFSEDAKNAGFIKEVISVKLLLERLITPAEAAMPVDSKLATNLNKGATVTDEEITTMQTENKVLKANRDTMKKRADSEFKIKQAEIIATATARIAQAYETGVATQSVMVAMIEASTEEEATAIALTAQPSSTAIGQGEKQIAMKNTGILAYAKANKGKF